ncbi:unnamed protein product [Peronospora belbahrii]|uniref:Uncharacterized protein n=1 Tax=Peronospora belbahrii TaxID=622444 RepID=A0ABN8D6U1_9STRA|nr:unnamed protein product [Peronospora belbahrii]
MEDGPSARQLLGSGRDMEEEMKHVLQFLDTSLITPPSGNDLTIQQQLPSLPERPPPREQQREILAMQSIGGGTYRELGEVIDLLGSLDANDTDVALQQQPQDVDYGREEDTRLDYDDMLSLNASSSSQMTRSTFLSSNCSGVDSISPVGLLNGPSMSPATINWLQSLVPSASTESLTGLVSPATLYGVGGGLAAGGIIGSSGGAGNVQADGATATRNGGLPRTPSCEIIDWKAYNESCIDKTQKEPVKWRVIPQHGPHADPATSSVCHSTNTKLLPGSVMTAELSTHKQLQKKMAEEKNKRKALVSPEYVQYGCPVSMAASARSQSLTGTGKTEHGLVQYATKVPEPTGRRPFKKSLHKTSPVPESSSILQLHQPQPEQSVVTTLSEASSTDGKDDVDWCVALTASHLSKVKDMQELLDSTVSYECCEGGGGVVQMLRNHAAIAPSVADVATTAISIAIFATTATLLA